MGSGRIVTEHDVRPDAWYLDGDRAPVCISVEAGQADLFLCAYLGIDFAVKGLRTYRLLDASVVFHSELPRPGDVIRYEITIDKFIRQADTYLFLFRFEGYIGNSRLISMSDGCAGFFTEAEIRHSGGIIAPDEDSRRFEGKMTDDWKTLVPVSKESYDQAAVDELRAGNLAGCFGELFSEIELAESLRLPGGRMKLIDRIQFLDPRGGRYGLGLIRAEADIQPDDWFLTCHFVDDMVMPGTLMYECCAHTLRVYLQRIGWVTAKTGVNYEPVIGVKSILKCRGPVTPANRQVIYEVEIKELGYGPEPFVIADAHMYADGHYIVYFKDMSMKMSGITRREIEACWRKKSSVTNQSSASDKKQVLFEKDKILEFAVGRPSLAFGDAYKDFDEKRFIARLPAPPYSFINRIITAEPPAWVLEPDGWVEAAYDVPPDAWYFRANQTPSMPYCILLEIGLQTCGWLAAYGGSALKSEKDLKFRNLEGSGILYQDATADSRLLTTRSRMTKISKVADIIIEAFDFEIWQTGKMIFEGNAAFGFFTPEALARQKGIRDADRYVYHPPTGEIKIGKTWVFKDAPPFTPDDPKTVTSAGLALPAKALRMIDRIEVYLPDGGPRRLGFIRGVKTVDPQEWFFKAHFFQDPVWPGSLGIESFLQLIKFMALDRWAPLAHTHRFEHVTENRHNWTYRGQVVPQNKEIIVEAVVIQIDETPHPTILANGWLKVDGLYIYKMDNFGFRLVPHAIR
jgi:3-hydroxymyristoyl/3-hydroxydecanoyl-(acyl carrier protein) dehydratase